MDRSADSPRLYGVWASARFSLAQANLIQEASQARTHSFEQRHGRRTSSCSAAHTTNYLVLLHLLWEVQCGLCASPSHRSTLFARQPIRAVYPSGCLNAASEITSFTPSRGDGLGPVLYSFATQRDPPMFGHSDVPLFVSAQPVLMEFFPVSFQHWLMEPFHTQRAKLCTASPPHAPSEPRLDPTILLWHRPSTFPLGSNSAPPTAPLQ